MMGMATKELSFGCEIGMAFDIGPVEDTVYGSADKLYGVVPLLIPQGHYVPPAIVDDPDRLKNLIQEKCVEYRDLWPNELDETVREKVTDFLMYLAYTHPIDDIMSPKMGGAILATCVSFAMDDVLDQLNDLETVKYNDIKKMLGFFVELFAGRYESPDDIPNPIEPLVPFNAALWKFIKFSQESIPNFLERNKAFTEDWLNTFYGFVLLMERAEDRGKFSQTSKTIFLAHLSGVSAGIEYLALITEATVGQDIRDDLLFQRMKLACGSASNLMNDVFGIGRDIRLKQENDTTILVDVKEHGVPLQVAFNKALKLLCDDMNDIKIANRKLRSCYAGDENLMKYLECAERAVDGQIYWYAQVARYGSINLRVVSL